MSQENTRVVKVRDAVQGEHCQDGALIAEDDFIPCEQPASVVLSVTEDGEEQILEFCADHAEPLLRHAAEQAGDTYRCGGNAGGKGGNPGCGEVIASAEGGFFDGEEVGEFWDEKQQRPLVMHGQCGLDAGLSVA